MRSVRYLNGALTPAAYNGAGSGRAGENSDVSFLTRLLLSRPKKRPMQNTRQLPCLAAILMLSSFPPDLNAATPTETRLMRFPDISNDQVVFVYAEDLWVASIKGGLAHRLTAHPGDELYPKFSPDGKWIAFTGEYDGNADVYVIPSEGGEPRRLTFHPGDDFVLGWTPDSKKILFRSNRASAPARYQRLFLVSLEGGLPEMLPVPRASLTSFSPDAQRIAYTSTSQEFRTWKRYRGGWSPAIGIYDLKKNTYEELPRSEEHTSELQ